MIYVSSSCVKAKKISDSIEFLVDKGIYNIELSGGTEYYEGIEEDLLRLKDKFKINLLCHNYFPPPKMPFVLNLASLDNQVYAASLNHLKKAIRLSKALGCERFAFHAGFFIDLNVSEIGKKVSRKEITNYDKSIAKFCEGYEILLKEAGGVKLYIENNVLSSINFANFGYINPFMLTTSEEYFDLREKIEFNLLLDFAHLKVSCRSLGLDFEVQAKELARETDYFHLSDNDGKEDQNKAFLKNSDLMRTLEQIKISEEAITLEVYEEFEMIQQSISNLNSIIKLD